MKMKNMLIGAAALLCAALFVTGCPQEPADNENGGKKTPDVLVAAIDIGAVQINPLPAAGSQLGNTPTGTVVINTERPPTADEIPEKVYYRPVQPVVVTLADANQTAYFADSAPDEYPASIERPGVPDPANPAKVKIDLRIATTDTRSESKSEFLVGRTVWIKVVSADESKTEYYRINVAHQNHDAAMSAIAVNGHEVLNANQTPHIGAWEEWNPIANAPLSTWEGALAGLVSVTQSEAAALAVTIAFRNNISPLAAPNAEYAKIVAADTANAAEPAAWSASPPASFANNDELAVKVTASNGTTKGYLRIKLKVGGIASLDSLSVNDTGITLGTPHADPNTVKDMGAFREEEYETLVSSGVAQWAVVPTASDPDATVTWALKAINVIPVDADYGTTSPLSFDTNNNYLWLKVVSQSGDHTMYYLVIYDERPKDTEHIIVGNKNAPIYKFTIPSGKTWADLGENPVMRLKVYMQDTVFNEQGNNHRNFVFGEISKIGAWNESNKADFYYNVGSSGFNTKMPFLVDRIAKDLAVDPSTAAPNVWFTIQYELTELPNDKRPWDPNTDWVTQSSYSSNLYPDSSTTGDVYFAAGISSNGKNEYWLKEISLESRDGSFKIFCDLLGNGRIDSPANTITTGWAATAGMPSVAPGDTALLRELVADPSLR